jgi:hypothetical protein
VSRKPLIPTFLMTTSTDTLVMKMAVCQSTRLFSKKKAMIPSPGKKVGSG